MMPGLRLVVATALVAAAGLLGSAPAYAEPCASASGVTVVVDFHELGGGLQQVCVADQGTADDLFVAAGYTLQTVNGQAFVCRVDGLPSQDEESCARTPPANAYWGVWWSDGRTGSWTYSSVGAYSLDVPDGGSVALSWNGSSTKSPPGAPPPRHEAAEEPTEETEPPEEPESTEEPTTRPSQPPTSGSDTGGGGTPSPSPSPSPRASASASSEARARDSRDDGNGGTSDRGHQRERDREGETVTSPAEPSTAPTDDAEPVAEPPGSGDDSALPVWVGPTAVSGLLGVAGVATYLRRRTS